MEGPTKVEVVKFLDSLLLNESTVNRMIVSWDVMTGVAALAHRSSPLPNSQTIKKAARGAAVASRMSVAGEGPMAKQTRAEFQSLAEHRGRHYGGGLEAAEEEEAEEVTAPDGNAENAENAGVGDGIQGGWEPA